MASKVRKVEIGDTRERSIHFRQKMHLRGCSNTFLKPSVVIFVAKSEYTHEKMGIQHTMLLRGTYTPYTIQTGVYTAFSISRGGIYTIQFTFPTPIKIDI